MASDPASPPLENTTHEPAVLMIGTRWLIGVVLLGAVVVVSLRFSEGEAFAALLTHVNAWWLLVGGLLQAATYLAQAQVFRTIPSRLGVHLPFGWTCQLSLAKLFVDQAIPSAGISSTAMIVKALRARGLDTAPVASIALVNIASYHAAYVISLVSALVFARVHGFSNVPILVVSILFLAFGIGVSATALAFAGRASLAESALFRIKVTRYAVRLFVEADGALIRHPLVLAAATLWQIAIFVLDAATTWALIRSLGATASGGAVFTSFMIASLFRTMGIVPGGLGTFEATSVVTLTLLGVELPVALSATLLFRGLSFWLPMLPGLWASHAVGRSTAPPTKDDAHSDHSAKKRGHSPIR